MMIVAVIVLMLTACRPGTIFSTTAWADRYLTWEVNFGDRTLD